MRTEFHGVQLRTGGGASVALFVNGVPWGHLPAGNPTVQNLAIEVDLVPGRNRVSARVGTAQVPAGGRRQMLPSAPAELFATMVLEVERIAGANPADYVRSAKDEADWRPGEGEPVEVPHELALSFDLPAGTLPPVWAEGPPVDPNAASEVVRTLLEAQHSRLANGEFRAFTAALQLRYRDHQRAFPLGQTAESRLSEDTANIASLFASEGTQLVPLPDLLYARGHAGNRLVELVRADGSAAIQILYPNGFLAQVHHRFASLGGHFHVVR